MEIMEPPPSRRYDNRKHWVDVAQKLRDEYPDQYGLVGNYSVGVATHIRMGRYPAFLPENPIDKRLYMERHWDITTRKSPDGRNDIYIKWVGRGCTCRDCS